MFVVLITCTFISLFFTFIYSFLLFLGVLQKFERRGRHVSQNERDTWSDVHPTMMSDEEEVDRKFKVCRQEWCSKEFNAFMETLDGRVSGYNCKHPRYQRFCGTPIKSTPPSDIKDWMVGTRTNNSDVLAPDTPELL